MSPEQSSNFAKGLLAIFSAVVFIPINPLIDFPLSNWELMGFILSPVLVGFGIYYILSLFWFFSPSTPAGRNRLNRIVGVFVSGAIFLLLVALIYSYIPAFRCNLDFFCGIEDDLNPGMMAGIVFVVIVVILGIICYAWQEEWEPYPYAGLSEDEWEDEP